MLDDFGPKPRLYAEQASEREPRRTQPVRVFDGGYEVLRPTKGWLRVSARRLEAQRRMAAMLMPASPKQDDFGPKMRRNDDPVWRKPFVRDFGARP